MSDAIVVPADPRFKDLTGKRFGKVSVIDYAGKRKGRSFWNCQCDCGKKMVVVTHWVQKLKGCRSCAGIEHGRTHTVEYKAWLCMRDRCNNANAQSYKDYGGRGITICERWNDFAMFYADMGKRPGPDHSLDRIDNNGNYEPSNCRWATKRQQVRNQRSRTKYEFNGQSKILSEWAFQTKIPRRVLSNRIYEGWSLELVFTTHWKPCPRKAKAPKAKASRKKAADRLF